MAGAETSSGGEGGKPRRRRGVKRLLLALVPLSPIILFLCLWARPLDPPCVTVVSLRQLADIGQRWIEIWPADERRSVSFVAWGGPSGPVLGTAGPAGVSVRDVTLPDGASGLLWFWHRDRMVYLDWGGGTAHLWSPSWRAPRKLTSEVEPRACGAPAWSPDGSRVALPVADSNGALRGVRIFSREGEALADTPLPTSESPWGRVVWAPSGRQILLERLWRTPGGGARRPGPRTLDAVVLSGPDWRPTAINPVRTTFSPVAWANDDVLAGTVGSATQRELEFVRPASGAKVGSFDCRWVRVGGPRMVRWVPDAQPVPSGAGVIAKCEAANPASVGLQQAGRTARGLPRAWRVRLLVASSRTRRWPRPRVAYVYVPLTGGPTQTLAIATGDSSCPATISADRAELLYVSDWELRAAPLPAEARSEGTTETD